MANTKISELTELSSPQSTDILPIVDNSGTPTTKKVQVANLVTKTLAGLSNVTNDAQAKALFTGYDEKTTLHNDDLFLINDSEASNAVKKVKKSNVSASSVTRGTFENGDLSSGDLTISHSLGLSAPYSLCIVIYDNNGKVVIPDDITGGANSHTVALDSYGTISGTWGYAYYK